MGSADFADSSAVFFIGICQTEKAAGEVKQLLASDKQFAILLSPGLLSEISREENSNGVEIHNKEIERQIHDLSKIVLSPEGETWLVRIYEQPKIVEVLISEQVGCDILEAETIIQDSLETLITQVTIFAYPGPVLL